MGYFDIKRDIELSSNGGFFCAACLIGKPADDMSPDSHYCLGCYEVLSDEAALVSHLSKASWKPVISDSYKTVEAISEGENKGDVIFDMGKEREVLVHTNSDNAQAYQNLPRDIVFDLGGRPKKDVPVKLIHKLAERLSYKQIVKELKEQGYSISPMTISRVLTGQRS